MGKKIVVFAGTSEGRRLVERCAARGRQVVACVATEYGEKLIPMHPGVQVHMGRMDKAQMEVFVRRQRPWIVVDATHPYAREVSKTVKAVCGSLGVEYVRLVRSSCEGSISDARLHWADDAGHAAQLAEGLSGNIFLATGSKELSVFVGQISDFSRIYARVLPSEETLGICKSLGLSGSQLICMQGPFSEELNRAMYAHVSAGILVTKESGDAGGFLPKIQAALTLGMECIVIRRPRERGLSFEAVCGRLGIGGEEGGTADAAGERELLLVGIGIGTPDGMTGEARAALAGVSVIFGAKRMLEAVQGFFGEKVCFYEGGRIAAYLREHPRVRRAAVVLSGDVGFFSGAAKLDALFSGEGWQVRRICGVSSLNYFAAKLGVPWQDMKLCSAHGREAGLPTQILRNRRVFSLFNDGAQLVELARSLPDEALAGVRLFVGFDLGYETEEIWRGTLGEFASEKPRKGLCVALFENGQADATVTGSLRDTAFFRGEVPLTKEEIRAVSLAKLRLTSDGVCYDIGAGTGGMTMDMARYVTDGKVIAFEKNPAACELIWENSRRFLGGRLTLAEGSAPEVLAGYEPPTHAFIGGSGGRLKDIVETLLEKNPGVRVVINAITLETLAEATGLLGALAVKDVEIVSVTAAKAKQAGPYHLMEGMNPVYIISFTGAGGEALPGKALTDV